uniref:Uncharacterized protein n=1 Tax=Vespula pensylvanica TaxID=30213 RepID=A0A834JNY2_VESPE|nr:hypothetical protein H0235_017352 [Vespula pensylvanica]
MYVKIEVARNWCNFATKVAMGGFATTSLREIASLVWVSEKQKGSEGKGGGSGGVVALVGQLVPREAEG